MVSEIQAKNFKLIWEIRKNLLKIICTIGNPEKIKENNINLMEIPKLKKFQSYVFHRGLMDINCNGPIETIKHAFYLSFIIKSDYIKKKSYFLFFNNCHFGLKFKHAASTILSF